MRRTRSKYVKQFEAIQKKNQKHIALDEIEKTVKNFIKSEKQDNEGLWIIEDKKGRIYRHKDKIKALKALAVIKGYHVDITREETNNQT